MTTTKDSILGNSARDADAEFIAAMEEHPRHIRSEPYDPNCPVLCMDEQPVQLHKETRKSIRGDEDVMHDVIDYEYERCGTAVRFHVHRAAFRVA